MRMSEGNLSSALTGQRAMTIWDFEVIFCPSRYVLRRLDSSWHPRTSGKDEILPEYNRREGEWIQANSLDRIPALGPMPQNSHGGNATDEIKPKIRNEGARTIPGCPEQGGNCDINNLS